MGAAMSILSSLNPRPTPSPDIFTNLPDDVFHRILFFLSAADIARAGLVSTQWRRLCLSTPFLRLDCCSAADRDSAMKYFDDLATIRQASEYSPPPDTWLIRWDCHSEAEEPRVLSWLLAAAASCTTKELSFSVANASGGLKIPPSLFSCRSSSLRSLSLDFASPLDWLPTFPTPSGGGGGGGFSSLRSLSLSYVAIGDGFGEWISQRCESLETLSLFMVGGAERVAIESRSLRRLEAFLRDGRLASFSVSAESLECLNLHWRPEKAGKRVLRVFAPKMKQLYLSGDNISEFVIEPPEESLNSLVRAGVHLQRPSSGSALAYWDQVIRVLQAIRTVKRLDLQDSMLQDLIKLNMLSTVFPNLTELHIFKENSFVDLVKALASFSAETPNLTQICIHMMSLKDEDDIIKSHLESLNGVKFMDNLKCLTIDLSISHWRDKLQQRIGSIN